ncbi:XdhC family protein [Fulvivirga sp. 29W222]|uniref:XdhC family protein n=1 Tax=Fulvivirga marina TaxID=2494733 RepID=A0A937G163_9BACT|nr:XdhC/CoxI family protein [Fulvivirga marina]MBL6449905.1 XdhC family protein [Fulvivirga marina]
MDFWSNTYRLLKAHKKAVLLYVLNSEGSSPGRQGFKMIVGPEGAMAGSIGGGIMEHKLVELSRSLLQNGKPPFTPFIKHQVHRAEAPDKSGMICSGEQTIAFYYLRFKDITWLEQLITCLQENKRGVLQLTEKEMIFLCDQSLSGQFNYTLQTQESWVCKEQIGFKNTVYIVGGGHVGLALSRIMRNLDFYVMVIDNRDGLNTMVENDHAHESQVVDYNKIENYIPDGEDRYVVLVSFGYRTDKVVLKRLIHKNFKYLGMMGSEEKVATLYKELQEEGITKDQLAKVHSPIGVQIKSKTPDEIAVSIAAEIIGVKNLR